MPIERDRPVLSATMRRIVRQAANKGNVLGSYLYNGAPHYISTAEINYIEGGKDGQLSYFPVNKLDGEYEEELWDSAKRAKGRAGRTLRRLVVEEFQHNISDADVEAICNLIAAEFAPTPGHFELVTGWDIKDWYDGNIYHDKSGTMINSCMRYDNCQSFFALYAYNPNQCAMLIYVSDEADEYQKGRLLGRALVWTLPNGQKVMDRIYSNDVTYEMFVDYAQEQGWWYRPQRGFTEEPTINNASGEEVDDRLVVPVELEHTKFRYYPYMDTFLYLDGNKLYYRGNTKGIGENYLNLTGTSGEINTYGYRVNPYDTFHHPDPRDPLYREYGRKLSRAA